MDGAKDWVRRILPRQHDGETTRFAMDGEGRLPGFLGIGVQKGATSWLWANLKEHPEVWMPPFKELHYFDHRHVADSRKWALGHIQGNATRALRWHVQQAGDKLDFSYVGYLAAAASQDVFSEAWYRRLFARPAAASRLCGDITPEYCQIGPEGIAEVKALLGRPKLIWTIREPVGRALSQIRMNLARRKAASDKVDWDQAMAEPAVLMRGDYRAYVPAWLEAFPREDILFVPFRDVAQRPEGLMREVERFLGLSRCDKYSQLHVRVHEGERMAIPDWVQGRLAERLAPQTEFLRDFFGRDFVERI